MEEVRCISERKTNPEQIKVGLIYFIDEDSIYTDNEGDTYADVYSDRSKEHLVGKLLKKHFVRYQNLSCDNLSYYINYHQGFLLRDIIDWCETHSHKRSTIDRYQLAEKLLEYINDNGLNTEENMDKQYIVNHVPFNEFASRDKAEEYRKYLGYSMYCVA